MLFVKLYPEVSSLSRDNPPIASFIIRVLCSVGDRKALTHPGNINIKLDSDDTIFCSSEKKNKTDSQGLMKNFPCRNQRQTDQEQRRFHLGN